MDGKALDRLAAIWALRAIINRRNFKKFLKRSLFANEDILKIVGLESLIGKDLSPMEFEKRFVSKLERLEKRPDRRRGQFFTSLNELSEVVGLTEAEKEILLFTLLMHQRDGLKEAIEYMGALDLSRTIHRLSEILRIERPKVQKALGRDSALCSSGLITVDRNYDTDICDRLDALNGLCDVLQEGHKNVEDMLFTYFRTASPPSLTRLDFLHLQQDLVIVYPYLKAARLKGLPGTNILFYGPPGTGKTELAKTIARDLDLKLYEVGCEDADGDPLSEKTRFKSYALCQRILRRTQDSMILFDEIEDVFPMKDLEFFGKVHQSGIHKGWTNRQLESNPVPTIWISNSIDHIDSAFIRRFDYTVEVPVPPGNARKKVAAKGVQGLPVSEEWLENMARNELLAPSQMEKAAKVASLVGSSDSRTVESILSRVIANAQKAMGLRERSRYRGGSSDVYDLGFVNADRDLRSVVEICGRKVSARICLYGPPGTGKTAFVHHIGKILGKSVLTKRASDILAPCVGLTEQNIAAMFREAQDQDVILLLDEADSFLQDRHKALHTWEITQVNELLVQMENYQGLFFCATNLMDLLDGAVYRRCQLKIKFGYLNHIQVCLLFERILGSFGYSIREGESNGWKSKLETLRAITPGDFETVRSRMDLMGMCINAEALFKELSSEVLAKPDARKRAPGFIETSKTRELST